MSTTRPQEIHTIFGAGQVGTQLARLLAAEGKQVRLVRRSAPGPEIAGVTWMRGDVQDAAFADAAAQGARTIYNTTNPRHYHRWDELLPPLFRAVWGAAARQGALLVQLDNLYMYGRPPTSPFDENTPANPVTAMGRLRAELAQELLGAHARGELRMTVGRASDYFGPDSPNTSTFRPDTLRAMARGGRVVVFGDPDTPHSYSYTPDVARGLAVLGTREGAEGRVWHLPVAAQMTTRALMERFAARAGTKIRVRRVPGWLLRAAGKLVPVLGAVASMSYQWDIPYLVDDRAFRHAFGVEPTDLDTAIDRTLAAATTPPT